MTKLSGSTFLKLITIGYDDQFKKKVTEEEGQISFMLSGKAAKLNL